MNGNILSSDSEAFLFERAKSILEASTGWEIHPAVSLLEVVDRSKRDKFTKEEWDFLYASSRVDVAITKSFGRRKVTIVLESDSSFHDSDQQKRRDNLKNNILKKTGIPLLRFRPKLHYKANMFGEEFIDAVLRNIANHAFREAVGLEGWLDVDWRSDDDHPMKLVFPFQKEYDDLRNQAYECAVVNQVNLEFLEEWDWEDEKNEIFYNRQILLGNKKSLTASTGRCSKQEFMFLANGPAAQFAEMGCLYKYLINKRVINPEKRQFLNFLADEKNRVPEDLLNPPPW